MPVAENLAIKAFRNLRLTYIAGKYFLTEEISAPHAQAGQSNVRRILGQAQESLQKALEKARTQMAQEAREAALKEAIEELRKVVPGAGEDELRTIVKRSLGTEVEVGGGTNTRPNVIRECVVDPGDVAEAEKLFGQPNRVRPVTAQQLQDFSAHVHSKFGTHVLQDGPTLVDDLVRLGVPREVAASMRLKGDSMAEFHAFDLGGGTQPTFIIHRRGPSAFHLAHEYGHLLHFHEVGGHAGWSLYTSPNREQWVYNYLRQYHWNKLTKDQQLDAAWYLMKKHGGFAW